MLCFVCIWKNSNFVHFSVLCFFYRVAFISSTQTTVIQFSTFLRSRLPFQLVLNNSSKNLVICLQYFDVLMILKGPFATDFPDHWNNSFPYTHDYPSTLLFGTQDKVFSSWILLKVKLKWRFAIDLYLLQIVYLKSLCFLEKPI